MYQSILRALAAGRVGVLSGVLAALALSAGTAEPKPPGVEDLFRMDEFTNVQLSPDGRTLSALLRYQRSRNIITMDLETAKVTTVTRYKDNDIRYYYWVNNDWLIYGLDRDFEDDARGGMIGEFSVHKGGEKRRRLGRTGGSLLHRLPADPSYVLVLLAGHRYRYPDVGKMHIETGRVIQTANNDFNIEEWIVDNQGRVRAAVDQNFDPYSLGYRLLYRETEDDEWQPILTYGIDELEVWGFDKSGRSLYVTSRINRERMALYALDVTTGQLGEPLHEDPVYDITTVVQDDDGTLQWVYLQADVPRRIYFDDVWEKRMTMIDRVLPDRVNHIWGAEENDNIYIVYSRSDRIPGEYYLLDLEKGDLRFLMAKRRWLEPEQLGRMKPVTWKARDGMQLHGYLTIPPGKNAKNLPLVVNPHGGPFGIRDTWEFDEEVQFWATRGYAVFQPNFRGSGGYGRAYETAGYHKWGLEMQDDITDGVKWLIEQDIADPERICICGASYGGYATLMGLIKTPDLYRCGVDYVGVVDLNLLHRDDAAARESHITNYEKTETWWKMTIGDPGEDRERFYQTSPINFVDRIQAPLLVIHGRLDPRVSKEHAQNLVSKLDAYDKEYEYIYEKWEGHGFFSEDNRFDLYRQMGAFLARHLR